MSDLDYNIKTTADLKAIKDAQDAVKGLNKSNQDSSPANEQAKKAEQEHAKATHELQEKKKLLLLQIKELKHTIPGATEVMHLLKHPMVAVGLAIATVIEGFQKYIEKIQQVAVESSQMERSISVFRDFHAGAAEAAISAKAFAEELAQINSKAETAAEGVKKLIEKQTLLSALEQEKGNASKAFEIADVHLRQAQRKITPVAAAKELGEINIRYERMADQKRLADLDKETAAAQAGLFGAGLERHNAEDRKGLAEGKIAALASRGARRDQAAADTESRAAARLPKIDEELDANVKKQAMMTAHLGNGLQEGDIAALQTQQKALEDEKRSIEAGRHARAEAKKIFEGEVAAAAKELKDSDTKIKELSVNEKEFQASLQRLKLQKQETAKALKEIGPLKAGTTQKETATTITREGIEAGHKYIQTGQQIGNEITHGRQPAPELIQAHRDSGRNVVESFNEVGEVVLQNNRELYGAVKELKRQLDAQGREIKAQARQIQNPQ